MNYGTWYNAYGTGEGYREKCAPQPAAAMFYPEEVRRRCVEQAQEKAPRYHHGSMEHEKEKNGIMVPYIVMCRYIVPMKSPGDKERGAHHVPARGSGKPDKEIRDALHEYVELQKPTIHAECVMPRLLS